MRVLFAGTPEFAVPPLAALSENHDIVGVFTQPDRPSGRGKKLTPPPVKVLAQKLGYAIHQPETLKNQTELIRALNPDVMVVVAYGMLLPQRILDCPKYGCINIHASILPRWRGAAPIHRAIEAGDKETGVAIMQMELGLDTGPVYETLTLPILPTDTTASMHDKLAELGAKGIVETLDKISQNPELKPIAQDETGACYAKKITKAEANLVWTLSATELDQKIRAFNPFPIAQCQHNGTRLRIWQSQPINDNQAGANTGQVVRVDETGPVVQCAEGQLRLQKLQRDGSKVLSWQEFVNGYRIDVGDQLS